MEYWKGLVFFYLLYYNCFSFKNCHIAILLYNCLIIRIYWYGNSFLNCHNLPYLAIKSAKYRCFRGILGQKIRKHWTKRPFPRYNAGRFQSLFCNFDRRRRRNYVPTYCLLHPDAVSKTFCLLSSKFLIRHDVILVLIIRLIEILVLIGIHLHVISTL